MSVYVDRIERASDFEELCNIVEDAADDDRITNEDYCTVYGMCLNKAQAIGSV